MKRCIAHRDGLAPDRRARVHLASLPMIDTEENAAIVNAVQRHATIIVQKSLAEGFGLTVAEAMWKSRPVVASRIGGIQEQIVDGETGLLLDDPHDLAAFGATLARLLDDPALARRLGDAAHERVREEFLAPRHLAQYVALIEWVSAGRAGERAEFPNPAVVNADVSRARRPYFRRVCSADVPPRRAGTAWWWASDGSPLAHLAVQYVAETAEPDDEVVIVYAYGAGARARARPPGPSISG